MPKISLAKLLLTSSMQFLSISNKTKTTTTTRCGGRCGNGAHTERLLVELTLGVGSALLRLMTVNDLRRDPLHAAYKHRSRVHTAPHRTAPRCKKTESSSFRKIQGERSSLCNAPNKVLQHSLIPCYILNTLSESTARAEAQITPSQILSCSFF